jgi:hypothetical protein
MKILKLVACALLFVGTLADLSDATMGGMGPRAMGLAQSYTALVRGPESVFWNPANLGLSGTRKFSWQVLNVGASLVTENNSFSVTTYNDYFTESNDSVSPRGTAYYINAEDKQDLLDDIPGEGLKMNVEVEPVLAAGLPINGGIAFPLPGGLQSALAFGLTMGLEGEMPKDMFELLLFGNQFAADRLAAGKEEGYDISEWNGSAWAIASLNWGIAKPWLPEELKPYLSEMAVGGTLKFTGGLYSEILESGGEGMVTRIDGAVVDAYAISQSAGDIDIDSETFELGGSGFGLDLGVAGVTKNGKTSFSVGLLNFLDTFSWSTEVRQDSLFVTADDLRITRMVDPKVENIEDVLDNEDVDKDGDKDFHKKIGEEDFSRSLPAMLRVGVAHELMERMTVVGNYDQAFSEGFGLSTTPRLSGGVEYRMVDWFPLRFGLSVGGRWSSSSALGFALGPFTMSRLQFRLLDLALVTRGGFFPGIAKGTAISVQFFRLDLI